MLYIYFENITFKDIVYELQKCFQDVGIETLVTSEINKTNYLDLYIIFGMNDFSAERPHNYIVYQLEQTTGNDESKWFGKVYLDHLKNALQIWDYSLVNYQNLRKLGFKNIKYVPMQYMKTVDRFHSVEPFPEKDIDVFFFGSLNDRRSQLINELKNHGLNVVIGNNTWGEDREQLISRSKLVLNIHYFQNAILETVRLSYLLSNNCIVISETSQDPILDRWHSKYVKLVPYESLVQTCLDFHHNPENAEEFQQNLAEYRSKSFSQQVPALEIKEKYGYLIRTFDPEKTSQPAQKDEKIELPNTDNSDLFSAECKVSEDQELILKLPKYNYNDLPNVSIVTITYNRRDLFPMAIRNWELFYYPRDKLEWIIVDDSDDGSTLSDLLPKSDQIKYYKLQTTGRLSIGQKRNFGVENATHDYVAFMDDDDYYYPLSIYARIGVLLKYPQYDCVGVAKLDIYDVVEDACARINSPYLSEASMAFKKSFWTEKQFPEKFNTLGEGYLFTKGRRDKLVMMPSGFNLIAFTHWNNYTQMNRSFKKFAHLKKSSTLLKVIDLKTRLFIFDLFDKIRIATKDK